MYFTIFLGQLTTSLILEEMNDQYLIDKLIRSNLIIALSIGSENLHLYNIAQFFKENITNAELCIEMLIG